MGDEERVITVHLTGPQYDVLRTAIYQTVIEHWSENSNFRPHRKTLSRALKRLEDAWHNGKRY